MLRVMTQEPVADRVEGADPAEALRDRVAQTAEGFGERSLHDVVRTALHLECRATRERQHEYAAGIYTIDGEMRDAVGQRAGLARAGASNNQQRTCLETFRQ